MALVLLNDSSLSAIADAIREKLDVETTYLPSEMAAAIGNIETGGTDLTSADAGKVVVESSGQYVLAAQTSRSVAQNGTYDTTTNNEIVVNVSGGGQSSVFTIAEVQSDIAPTVTLDGTTLQGVQDSGDATTTRYIVPSSGAMVVDNGTLTNTVQVVEYLKPISVYLRVPYYMEVIDASDGTVTCKWNDRTFTTVVNSGKFVAAVAKNKSGYLTVGLYTLTDYGVVGNVISGGFTSKKTLTITDRNGTSITVYAYGGFSGGFSGNISAKITVGQDTLLEDTANNIDFLAPYDGDSSEPYYSLDNNYKNMFAILLSQTV